MNSGHHIKMDNLQQVDAWLAALLNQLEPTQRSRMLRERWVGRT